MIEINHDTIAQYQKLLIELGGLYMVQEDKTIMNVSAKELAAINVGKKNLPIVLFHEGMCIGDYAILNPFKENLGLNREREWFYDTLQGIVGFLLKDLMRELIKSACTDKNEDEDNYAKFPLVNSIRKHADMTMLEELDKCKLSEIFCIFYNKKTKNAEAQTILFDEEFQERHSKFRKKTWVVFAILFTQLLGTVTIDEDYQYTAKLLNIPETDAKLHVLTAIVNAIGPFVKDILGIDLHEFELTQHLEVLEGYSKLYEWACTAKVGAASVPTSTPPFAQPSPFAATPSFDINNLVPVNTASNMINQNSFVPTGSIPMIAQGMPFCDAGTNMVNIVPTGSVGLRYNNIQYPQQQYMQQQYMQQQYMQPGFVNY